MTDEKNTEHQATTDPQGRLDTLVRRYPLDIQNVGEDIYMLMSKGYHDPHEFMKAVTDEGYDWPLGWPTHEWVRTIPAPKNSGYAFIYIKAEPGSRGAFPATYAREAFGDDIYDA